MRVSYKGKDENYDYRVAEITFEDLKEDEEVERLIRIMEVKGWDIEVVTNGYAMCEVEDIDEYREFVKDYKTVKRDLKLWKQTERLIKNGL